MSLLLFGLYVLVGSVILGVGIAIGVFIVETMFMKRARRICSNDNSGPPDMAIAKGLGW